MQLPDLSVKKNLRQVDMPLKSFKQSFQEFIRKSILLNVLRLFLLFFYFFISFLCCLFIFFLAWNTEKHPTNFGFYIIDIAYWIFLFSLFFFRWVFSFLRAELVSLNIFSKLFSYLNYPVLLLLAKGENQLLHRMSRDSLSINSESYIEWEFV